MDENDYKELLMQLLGSLTICEHMGDVARDVEYVLKKLGHDFKWYELHEVADYFGSIGATTLYGTSLVDE
jgi:hypothetical protein